LEKRKKLKEKMIIMIGSIREKKKIELSLNTIKGKNYASSFCVIPNKNKIL